MNSWVAQAQKGDQNAFFQLYQQFKGRVYAVCWRLLAEQTQAEDACQEAFVRAWQQLPSFRGDSSFSTWLHTISSRAAVDIWRKNKVLRLVTSDDVEQSFEQVEPLCKSIEQAISKITSASQSCFCFVCHRRLSAR
ncbi:MAG: RNA polymerase sigma factor [Rheinheimera sp.]|nr:RNA polymerase sigma factor [Rheinheimera sp.]